MPETVGRAAQLLSEPAGIKQRAAIVPAPVSYRCLVPIGGPAVREHQEAIP